MTPDVWNKMRDLRPEELPAVLAELDSCGLFPAPEETLEQFRSRLAAMFQELEAIRNGSSELQELIGQAPPVSGELRREADQLTWAKYRFRAGWIPAWYSTRQTGFFFGRNPAGGRSAVAAALPARRIPPPEGPPGIRRRRNHGA